MLRISRKSEIGGERGIRTLGRVSPTHAFQACSIDHSDISPFRINELRPVLNSVAQNPPSRISDSRCRVASIVYRHAHRDANVNCVRPINLARSLTGILESKRVDHCGQRTRLLSSTRVVQEEPWERLTPLLKDANERARIEVWRGPILSEVRQADPIESSANDQVHVVHD